MLPYDLRQALRVWFAVRLSYIIVRLSVCAFFIIIFESPFAIGYGVLKDVIASEIF
ncbi:hypothetical protein Dd1591_2778 [Dickeya chrysanthemi Ech1591]|uniref:Uncharacterized protein n=1 Tax=Dickeya chrysanthemi (strain Ech1591) TaxID=561229 RepID=C6CNS6_DICC1|nr:hypothetical protein Dd1591_2778 [Dickeya chrysanthemi Ech1591]